MLSTCCGADGKDGRGDLRVLLINCLPWKGLLSICRVAPGQVGGKAMPLLLASPVIAAGGELPAQCTRDRPDISPPLTWCGVPDGTKSLVLVPEDPDAPSGIFRHRAVFDIPRGSHGLGAGYSKNPTVAGLHEARHDFGKPAYGSPCPPKGTITTSACVQ